MVDRNITCQSCMFKDHRGGQNPECEECWVRYILRLIDHTESFGADPEIVRDRVFEELAKRRK